MSGESYTGVKFKTVALSRSCPTTPLAEELAGWCREFARLGLAPSHPSGSYGNLSVRIRPGKPEFLITRTSAQLANVTAEDLVLVERFDIPSLTIWTRGRWEPSSESFIHARLYEERPDAHAIFHGHSGEILAMQDIPCTPMELPYGTLELMDAALALKDFSLFNLHSHGFFSLGSNMTEAGQQAIALLNGMR